MKAARYLIVNADDFGQSAGINRGIVAAYQQGIVTSASLMVRWPFAQEAADYARSKPALSLGLHLDLGEWFYDHGEWRAVYEVVDMSDAGQIENEVRQQIESFRALAGHDPTHIDSHQHVHLQEPVRSILFAAATELGKPLRSCDGEISYCGGFYGQTAQGDDLPNVITVVGLKKIIAELSDGISELGCHPGFADDIETMYRQQRADEVAVLCDPRIKTAVAKLGFKLVSFKQLPVAA